MPRPTYSIDLPSPKHFDDESSDYGDDNSDLELQDFDRARHDLSAPDTATGRGPPASWRTMPHKSQLVILSSSRFADFFQMACLQAIMFHQLRSFDKGASDSTISWQSGILQGSFNAAQIFSAIFWGRVADAAWGGRKRVLLVGFIGTSISCVGVAFAQSFVVATLWRFLAGLVNGTLGAARTMVAETVERKFHSRAFILLPLAFNIANILGPFLGGLLAEPVVGFAGLFGPGSFFGGAEGVSWMTKYPYAAPSLLSAFICLLEAGIVYLGLVETLESRRYARDTGVELAEILKRRLPFVRRRRLHYTRLSVNDALIFEAPASPDERANTAERPPSLGPSLPFSRIWTRNVLCALLASALLHFHLGATPTLWPTFLSTSHSEPSASSRPRKLPFIFAGGLSLAPRTVGLAMAILGVTGVVVQLILYPRVDQRFGVVASFRYALFLFPFAYFVAPYLALIPEHSVLLLWLGISSVLFLQMTAQTFAVPALILLTNNSSPHSSVLATIHGVEQSIASASKTAGSFLAGTWFAIGLKNGVVGTAWWAVAVVSIFGWISSFLVRNGNS